MYFRNFPKLIFKGSTASTGGYQEAVDILRRVGFSTSGKTAAQHFTKYNIKDNDTPESLANKLYGSSDYHWILLLFNDIIDPLFEWPMNHRRFENYINKKYKGTDVFLGEGISGTFKVGDTVGVISSGVDGETGFGGLVEGYDPTYKRLRIVGLSPGESFSDQDYIQSYNSDGGVDWNDCQGGGTVEKVVSDVKQSIHHFGLSGSITAGYNDVGGGTATASMQLDPLSKYTSNGATGIGTGGIGYGDTLMYGYIFNDTQDYVITNEQYELNLNESKREISILQSQYVPVVIKEFKHLIKSTR